MFRGFHNLRVFSRTANFLRVVSSQGCSNALRLSSNYSKRHCEFHTANYCRKKHIAPNIMIGGILTFLGLAKDDEEKEPELITILKRSILLIQKEEFKRAEEMLHIALKLAQDQQNAEGITYVFDIMANLAYDIGDYSKAQKLFVSVMQRLMANGVEANDNRMIHISVKLAKIYENLGDVKKAEDGYMFCVENLEQKVTKEADHSEDTLLLWAMALDFYAHFLLERNRLQEAYDCFEKAYNTCLKVSGKFNEQVVVLLNDLGTVCNLLGHTDRAVSFFEEAVEIGKQLPEMQDLGSVYVNLGHIYFQKKLLSECEKACTYGKKSAAKYGDKETEEEADDCLKQVRQAMHG